MTFPFDGLPLFGICPGCGELCAHAGNGESLCCGERLTDLRTQHEIDFDRQADEALAAHYELESRRDGHV